MLQKNGVSEALVCVGRKSRTAEEGTTAEEESKSQGERLEKDSSRIDTGTVNELRFLKSEVSALLE